jgi:uncharacterized protein YutE (UPF0331/DUF86 family)
VIRERNLRSPETEEQSFFILAKNNIITEKLANRLSEAKGMRNVIIHNYKNVDDEIVFSSVTKEIVLDATEFIDCIDNLGNNL